MIMSEFDLIEAAKTGNLAAAEELMKSGADLNQTDEQGWTPLNFAAGRGDLALVRLLVEGGADIRKVGRDQRTPYLIALAAGRIEVAKFLQEMESKTAGGSSEPARQYCKAYQLADLRRFPGWREDQTGRKAKKEGEEGLRDDSIVYLHQDYSVTESIWSNENVIFNDDSDEWKAFCTSTLNFSIPRMIDLATSGNQAALIH
jgi:uncharacterized protein